MYSESTILVLGGKSDDPEDIARVLADQFRVIEADSADEGLAQLSNGVDLVVADLATAKSSVLDLLERGKARRPEIPFLVVTHKDDLNGAVEAMKLGAADCLVKPVNRQELHDAVSDLLATSRSTERSSAEPPSQNSSHIDIPPGTSLEDLERAAVEQALTQHQGNRTHAAKTLGISVRTLQRKLKAWGIPLVAAAASARPSNFILPTNGGQSAYNVHAHSH
jgi:DNA-binding NtrC family response regulator